MIAAKWDITSKCNLRCTHCSVASAYFSGTPCRNLTLAEKVKVLDNLAEGGVTHLSLLGGEPLTLGKELLTLISHAKHLGMTVGVVTNGILLGETTCRELIDIGLDRIIVSIESAHAQQHDQIRGQGTFDKAVSNLRRFSALRGAQRSPSLSINSVLCRANRDNFVDIVPFCQSLGAEEWTALSLNHTGNAEGNLANLILDPTEHTAVAIELATRLQEWRTQSPRFRINIQLMYPLVWEYIAKKYGVAAPWPQVCCSAARSLVYVAPDGAIHLCDRVHGGIYADAAINGEAIHATDLVSNSFADVWASGQYAKMFQFIKNAETYAKYSPCERCKYLAAGLCEPCPLYSLEGRAITFSQCLEAEKFLGDISCPVDWSTIPTIERRGRYEEVWSMEEQHLPEEPADMLARPEPTVGNRYYRYADGDAVIYNPHTAQSLKMNPMANAIWESVDGRQTNQEIIAHALDLYTSASEALAGKRPTEGQLSRLAVRAKGFLAHMEIEGFLAVSGSFRPRI